MEKIKFEKVENPKVKPSMDGLAFGSCFTDYMFQMEYNKGEGWINPRVVPYGNISLPPAAMVFHYGQTIFEGMKAYRTPEGKVQLFRPIENIRRMNKSGERLCIPQVPEELFMDALKAVVSANADWVPTEPAASLYIRPFIIATEEQVSVHASHSYIFCIICAPVGSYYKEGINPVKILVEDEDVRAVRGGTGYTKCGGNYGASIRAGEKATSKGYAQVMWLDGIERKYIDEVGSMNVMFKIAGKLITPDLTGSVLPGITRKSCLDLARAWGIEVEERPVSIDELIEAIENNTLEEAWGTGTAAVVSPIGELSYMGKSYVVAGGKMGEFVQKLYNTLTDIQWGKSEDTLDWTVPVC